MPAKIEDVARQAGVSTATVSRVLSGKPYVSDDLRERVMSAVQDLNYRPSRVARSLRVQRSSIIGLIVSDIQNPFFTSVVRAVEDTAYQHKFSVFLCNSDENSEKETMYVELMVAEHVAGVILSPTLGQNDIYRHLAEAGVPAVAIDRRVTNVDIDTVLVDNVGAARQAVLHLLEMGHRRIGAVIGTPVSSTGEERLRGYVEALQVYGIAVEPELIRTGRTAHRYRPRLCQRAVGPAAAAVRDLHRQQLAHARRFERHPRTRPAYSRRHWDCRLRRNGMDVLCKTGVNRSRPADL